MCVVISCDSPRKHQDKFLVAKEAALLNDIEKCKKK